LPARDCRGLGELAHILMQSRARSRQMKKKMNERLLENRQQVNFIQDLKYLYDD